MTTPDTGYEGWAPPRRRPPAGRRSREDAAAAARRRRYGTIRVAVLVTALVLAAGWGVLASRGEAGHHRQFAVGQSVGVPGALVSVDKAFDNTPDMSMTMAGGGSTSSGSGGMGSNSMTSGSGMAMPGTKAGDRQITVAVTVFATARTGFVFRGDDFRLVGNGIRHALKPTKVGQGPQRVPRSTATTRTLEFSVPKSATNLTLTLPGSSDRIALGIAPAR